MFLNIKVKIKRIINLVLKKDFLLIGILLMVLTPLYLFKINSIPTSLHGDEGETALQAIQIIKNGFNIYGLGWYDLPLLSFLPHAITIFIFGKNIVADRLGSVIFGITTLPFFYLLIKDFWRSKSLALTSTVLLGTSHLWLALSRLGLPYVQSTFFVIITIYFLSKAINENKKILFATSGALLGLSMYSYFGVRILPFLAILLIVYYLFKKRFSKQIFVNILTFTVTFVIIFIPLATIYFRNPEAFSSRQNQISIFSPEAKTWTNYQNLSSTQILLEQTKRTLNIFEGDNSTQYGFKGQLLDYLSIIFLTVGFFYSLLKIKRFKYQFILFWLLLSIAGQIFTTIPPPIFLPRFVVGLPILYFYISLGVYVLINKTINTFTVNKTIFLGVLGIFIAIIIFSNINIYFLMYPKQIAGDRNARAATNISKLINKSYKNLTIYFLTKPSLFSDFGTIRFLSPNTNRITLEIPDESNYQTSLGLNKLENNSVFIIYPQYNYLISKLNNIFPKNKLSTMREIDQSIQFYIFKPK